MGKRGLIILSRELLDEYIDERGLDQITTKDKVRWRHHCGTEWEATVKNRKQGYGCPACGGSQKGAFRKHPDFSQIAAYVPDDAINQTKINPPCSAGCGKEYTVSISNWLQGSRRHVECAGSGKRDDYQLPPGTVCLDTEQYVKVGAKSKLPFKCARGHVFLSRKCSQHRAALAGTTGCPHCAQNYPLTSRLATEARDILAYGCIASPASAMAILTALGRSKKEITAYKRMFELMQQGMTTTEAIRMISSLGEDDLDGKEGDKGITAFGPSSVTPTPTPPPEPQSPELPGPHPELQRQPEPTRPPRDNPATPPRKSDPWTLKRVDELFIHLQTPDRLLEGAPQDGNTAYQFLVDEQVAILWHAYCDFESSPEQNRATLTALVAKVREQATSSSRLISTISRTFLHQHDGAAALDVPADFEPRDGDNKRLQLRMMQRLIAWHLTEGGRQRFGNWSAPGAGKTLAALLTARLARSRLTVVICPNNVIPTWQAQIDRTFKTRQRTEIQTWQPHDDADFLILNYDRLQGADAEAQALKLCEEYGSRIGLVVVDECHRVKNDGKIGQQEGSSRRHILDAIVQALPNAKLLIQTGTPVLTGCAEGVSLIDLIDETAQTTYGFTRKNSFNECMRLHQAMTRYGVRFKPRVGVELLSPTVRRADGGKYCQSKDGKRGLELVTPRADLAPIIEITDATAIERLSRLKQGRTWSWLDIDEILTPFKLDAIVEAIRPGTVVYTEHVGGDRADPVVTTIARAVKRAGFTVAVFDGRADSVKGHDTIAAVNGTCSCKRCRGLAAFKRGEVAVLVASRTIGEGVDGLQQVGNRVIVNSPPWHDGAWEQLVGRWFRSGQTRNVEVVVPITWMASPSGRVSLDMLRLSRINDRGNIADAVVDGALPTHVGGLAELVTAAKAELEKLAACSG